jgi:hypothetical protein
MNTKAQLAIAFGAGVLATAAVFYLRDRPSTYAECVLTSGPAGSDLEASLIARACRDRFPSESPAKHAEQDIAHPESLLTLDEPTEPAAGNTFRGWLYNSSDRVTITEVDIAHGEMAGRDTTSRVYRIGVSIPPRSARQFTVEVLPTRDFYSLISGWRVVGAKGFRSSP